MMIVLSFRRCNIEDRVKSDLDYFRDVISPIWSAKVVVRLLLVLRQSRSGREERVAERALVMRCGLLLVLILLLGLKKR